MLDAPRLLLPRLAAVLAIALALLAGGCDRNTGADGAGVLRVDVIDDGADASAGATQLGKRLQLKGLVQYDAAGKVVPGLATSWRITDDGRSVIFRLRDAKWSDGRRVTADEVVTSFRRLLGPGRRSTVAALLGRIENAPKVAAGQLPPKALGISAPVRNVVEIRLSAPMPELLQVLALPDAVVQRAGRNPAVNGPFLEVGGARQGRGTQARFEPNRDYFAAADIKLSGVSVELTPDSTTSVARFTRDATDVVLGGGIGGLGEARTLIKPASLHIMPARGVYGYVYNVGNGALADARVRDALAMAIDRDALIRRLFAVAGMVGIEGVLPASLIADPVRPGWSGLPMPERQAQARALLAAAGYGAERPLRLTVRLPAGRGHAIVLSAISAQLVTLGVTLEPRIESDAAHAKAVARGDFELALVERVSPVDTPWPVLARLACSARIGGYCNAPADALVKAALAAPTIGDRAALLAQAQNLLLADPPMLGLFTPLRWSLVNPRVSGWVDNIDGRHPVERLAKTPKRRFIN